MEEPKSLDSLFKEKIFRIPDYQRGYAWRREQLKDFWEDLVNLSENRAHYTGVLTLKLLPTADTPENAKEFWLVDDHSYKVYHIVDGQQRLTTFVIFLQAFVDLFKSLPEFAGLADQDIFISDSLSVAALQEKFLFKTKPTGDHFRTYKFGYTVDNPSYEYLRHRILGESGSGSIQETFYTLNLSDAKDYFTQQLSELHQQEGLLGLQSVYKKLTKRFLFNEYIIRDEFDVFVAFETMNNRGKKLSDLELLKNRLIYLTTLYGDDELDLAERNSLRTTVNNAWREVYYQLGRNKHRPLNDDDFLQAHWTMYFKYSRKTGKDYIHFLLTEQFSPQKVHKKVERSVLLQDVQEQSSSNDFEGLDEEGSEVAEAEEMSVVSAAQLRPTEIRDFVASLRESAVHWFNTWNPVLADGLTDEEKQWIDRLNRVASPFDFWNRLWQVYGPTPPPIVGPRLLIYPVYTSFGVAPLEQGNPAWALNNWSSWESAYYLAGSPSHVMGPEVDLKAAGAVLNTGQDDLFTQIWQEGRSEGVYSPSAECTLANPSTAPSNLTGNQGVYIEGGGCGPIVPPMPAVECGSASTTVFTIDGQGCTDHRSLQPFWYDTARFGSVLSDDPVNYIIYLASATGVRPSAGFTCIGVCKDGGGTGPILVGTGGAANPPTYVPTIQTDNLYKIWNVNSNQVLGVAYAALNAGADVIQYTDNGTNDHLWHIMPAGPNQYLIVNYNSGECLGITMGSLTAGAFAQQWSDNGSADHLWTFVNAGNGMVKIKNVQSGLYLGIDNGLTTPGLRALQWGDNGTPDHLWRLQLTTSISFVGPGLESGSVTPVHDPSMIKDHSIDKYYVFATGSKIMERYSTDRTAFGPGTESYNYAFSNIPAWAQAYNSTDLWAPDASWDSVHHSWTLYYAASTFGSNHSAIGVATSANAEPQTWVDSGGPVLTSDTCSGTNAIDPGLVTDPSNGNQFLSFGSWWGGIYMIRIDPNTHKQFAGDRTCYHLASRFVGTDLEGSYVYPHGGYFYLFVSAGICCQAWNSTYHVLVGRATTVTGPYVDRAGVPLTLGGGTVFLGTHANVIGPGGGTVMPDADGDVYVYHWYDLNNHGMQTLGINRIAWSADGWPSIN